jgi:uncharacterized protein RhaS with RHS repeats
MAICYRTAPGHSLGTPRTRWLRSPTPTVRVPTLLITVQARVEIVEKNSSGTVTSTKWFVGNEERDASNTVTSRYFSQGEQQIVSGTTTNYFYTRDHLGSIREVIAADGTTIASRYSYDPYGRRTKVSGSIDSDFGFTSDY